MNKADIENKKSIGRTLFLSGMEQTDIASKIGVTPVTVSRWVTAEHWKEARAAKNVTRPELVNKLLLTINKLIEQVNESKDPKTTSILTATLPDKLAKLSATIEKLDKKTNVVDAVNVFIDFSKWLENRSLEDGELKLELLKAINHYQDLYLNEQMSQ